VLLYECGELGTGKVLEQLIEEARDLYDWIALLWAAFGEAPAKEWLANVNYRRVFPSFQTVNTCLGQEWIFLDICCDILQRTEVVVRLKDVVRACGAHDYFLGADCSGYMEEMLRTCRPDAHPAGA